MTAGEKMAAFIDALGLPSGARVDARVPKKLLVEQGAPTSADKRAIQNGIDELQWFAACKPATIAVPAFSDDTREYLEIAVVGCAFRADAEGKPAKVTRLIELIHRAIPYPVLLITDDESGLAVSAAHKRRAHNEAGRIVIDRVVVVTGLGLEQGNEVEAAFLTSLPLVQQPRTNLYALYSAWLSRIEAINVARLTGSFAATDDSTTIERRRSALDEHARLEKEVDALRAMAKREKQISRRVNLNIEIQRREADIAAYKKNL